MSSPANRIRQAKAVLIRTEHSRRHIARFMRIAAIAAISAAGALLMPNSTAWAQDAANYQGPDRQQRLLEGATKEGELQLYTSTPADEISVLIAAFEKKYGIKVKLWRSGSDMVVQRGQGVGSAKVTVPVQPKPVAAKAEPAPSAGEPRKKMSFKQKFALESLPQRMDGFRAQMAKAQAVLADAGLYARDPAVFDKATNAYAAAEKALAAAEEEWLELEMLREELGG